MFNSRYRHRANGEKVSRWAHNPEIGRSIRQALPLKIEYADAHHQHYGVGLWVSRRVCKTLPRGFESLLRHRYQMPKNTNPRLGL